MLTRNYSKLGAALGGILLTISPAYSQFSQASVYDDEDKVFHTYDARQLNEVDGYVTRAENLEFSDYGGWKLKRVNATGFFRVEQINDRWWIIDPEGYLYIHKAVNSVQLFNGFTPDDVYKLLPKFGMNGTGNWSDFEIQDSTLKEDTPLAYCPKFSFVSSYKNTRADRLPIAVFDDEFVKFCEDEAKQFAKYKDDPQVLGYFIDNELSWTFTGGLESHLNVNNSSDKNYQAAVNFLNDRNVALNNFTDSDADDYAAVMAERYLSVVTQAVREVDPNHMILGPRFNKSWNRTKEFMEAAGRHLDIVALNHYHRWGSRSNELENIAKWTGRPLLISEFYAMEKIPNFEENGAGWRVEDEASRALFYQNFVTTQLEKDYIVGFHWFNFQDDFKDNSTSEAKAKRGLIDIKGDSYIQLQNSMKHMNDRIYDYIDFVDNNNKPDLTIVAEADAYFQDGTNFGTDPELWAKTGNEKFDRSFCVRFDASAVKGDVKSAKIQLFGTSPEEKLTGAYRAELVTDNSWSETGITAKNRPESTTLLAEWGHGDDIEIDVTEELLEALSGDSKISIRVYGTVKNGLLLQYGAREYPDSYAHPKLLVSYEEENEQAEVKPIAHWAMNEASGNIINDRSGNAYHATLTGASWDIEGASGSALSFQPQSGGINLPVAAFAHLDKEVTIAMWTKGTSNQPLKNINLRALSNSARTLNIHLPWKNSSVYWDAGSTGSSYDRINSPANASLYENDWNHWAFTKNTNTGVMNIYVNGELFHTGTSKTHNMTGITSAVLGSNYSGSMDEVMLFDQELSLAKIKELYNPEAVHTANVALGKTATQSSTAFNGRASKAIDGNTNTDWSGGSITHTANSNNPSWQVHLGSNHTIYEIDIYNRTGSDTLLERLTNFTVSVIDSTGKTTFSRSYTSYPDPAVTVSTGGVSGQIVKIQLNNSGYLSLAEVEVYGEEEENRLVPIAF